MTIPAGAIAPTGGAIVPALTSAPNAPAPAPAAAPAATIAAPEAPRRPVPPPSDKGHAHEMLRADDDTFAREFLGLGQSAPPRVEAPAAAAPAAPAPQAAPPVPPVTQPAAAAVAPVAGDVEEVQLTIEEANAERSAAGWTALANGQWRRPDGTFAGADELPEREIDAGAPPAAASSQPAALGAPGAPPAAPAPALDRPLFAQFSAKEGDAEAPAEQLAAKLKVSFKADGQEFTDVPLDKVVRMAQFGAYNERRQQETLAVQQRSAQIEEAASGVLARHQDLEQRYRAILADDSGQAWLAERQRLERENSPAAQLERERQALQQQQLSLQQQLRTQHAASFVTSLAPKFEALQAQFSTLSQAEILGQFSLLTAPLMRQGQIPPEHFPMVEREVEGSLAAWAASTHEQRARATADATRRNEDALRKERGEKVVLKRRLTRITRPLGTAPVAGVASGSQTNQRYQRADDILADVANLVRPG